MAQQNMPSHLKDDMHASAIQLPVRPFFYTVDQLASILSCNEDWLKKSVLWYQDRDKRQKTREHMYAVNIAQMTEKPEWRVSEKEFLRWLRVKRIKYSATTGRQRAY